MNTWKRSDFMSSTLLRSSTARHLSCLNSLQKWQQAAQQQQVSYKKTQWLSKSMFAIRTGGQRSCPDMQISCPA
jgi:hypothetical protein